MEQPRGVSRFTIALNGAFCFRTYPLLRISWYRGVPFWNPLHLVAENSAAKDHSAVLRAGSQAAAHPPGCPQFWGDPEHHGDAAGIFFTRVHLRDLTKMLTSTKSQIAQSPQTVTAHV